MMKLVTVMLCCWQWNTNHRRLVYIQLCLVLSSPSCTCILPSTFLSPGLFQIFLARPLPLCPCGVHCSACLVMLISFVLNVCPSQFHFYQRVSIASYANRWYSQRRNVRLSVCLSHSGIVSKRRKLAS